MENDGERTISAWDVGAFQPVKDRRRRGFGSWLTKKSREGYKGQWQQESPAPGTSEMLSRYGLQRIINEERLYRLEEWDMGRVEGNAQEKDESLRMGFRQDKRGVRVW